MILATFRSLYRPVNKEKRAILLLIPFIIEHKLTMILFPLKLEGLRLDRLRRLLYILLVNPLFEQPNHLVFLLALFLVQLDPLRMNVRQSLLLPF